jgi:hypothetical protein
MAKHIGKPARAKGTNKGPLAKGPRKKPSPSVRPAKAPAKAGTGLVYPIKITLDNVQPSIWRRVQVKDCTLADLHHIIQISMGWDDAHLHVFEVSGQQYGDPMQWEGPDVWGEAEVGDEDKVKLGQLLDGGVKKFHYEYDMGDSWGHTIQLEKPLPTEAGARYPRCLDGARACPPEDCGGPWGYADLVQALQGPPSARDEDLLEWLGDDFNPEWFDPEEVNRHLRGVG